MVLVAENFLEEDKFLVLKKMCKKCNTQLYQIVKMPDYYFCHKCGDSVKL